MVSPCFTCVNTRGRGLGGNMCTFTLTRGIKTVNLQLLDCAFGTIHYLGEENKTQNSVVLLMCGHSVWNSTDPVNRSGV